MATSSGSAVKEKRQGKAGLFFRGVWNELKKVHWPNKKQVLTYTLIVIVFVLLVSAALFLVDTPLDILFKKLVQL